MAFRYTTKVVSQSGYGEQVLSLASFWTFLFVVLDPNYQLYQMNYQTPKRTRPFEWVVCICYAVVAIFLICAGVYGSYYGTTPREKIEVVTGLAEDVEFSAVDGRYGNSTGFVHFRVGPHAVSYTNKQNGFDRLVDAVRKGQEITIGVSTARETIIPRRGWVPLYEVSIGPDVIWTYEDTVKVQSQASHSPYFFGVAFLCAFGWCLHRCYTNRNLPRAL